MKVIACAAVDNIRVGATIAGATSNSNAIGTHNGARAIAHVNVLPWFHSCFTAFQSNGEVRGVSD